MCHFFSLAFPFVLFIAIDTSVINRQVVVFDGCDQTVSDWMLQQKGSGLDSKRAVAPEPTHRF
jgi:hypothetical protein